jgi:hypothetical protein
VIDGEAAIENYAIQNGDPQARLAGPEVLVYLKLAPGLESSAVQELAARLTSGWAQLPAIAAGVDSLGIKVV